MLKGLKTLTAKLPLPISVNGFSVCGARKCISMCPSEPLQRVLVEVLYQCEVSKWNPLQADLVSPLILLNMVPSGTK